MNYLRLLGITVLFVFVGLGTVGGCGSSGGGDNNPRPTNPPAQCQAPPLDTDFSDEVLRGPQPATVFFFVDDVNSVLIVLTSDGVNVDLTLSDIPDSGAVIGLSAMAQGENLCDITLALLTSTFTPDILADASGECVRLENGETLEVNDLVVADEPLGIDLSGNCQVVEPLDTADLNEARHMVIEKMAANSRVRSLDEGQTNILDFVEDISVSSE